MQYTVETFGKIRSRIVLNNQGEKAMQVEGRTLGGQPMPKNAHKAYKACCPEAIGALLENHGYSVQRRMRGRTAFLEARLTGADYQGEYRGYAKIAFDHNGRRSVRIAPGALRMECYNEFQSGNIERLHHCGEVMKRFLVEPWVFLDEMSWEALRMAKRIESLRHVSRCELDNMWIQVLLADKKTLRRRVEASMNRLYIKKAVPGPWRTLQAFTDTKSPALVKATSDLLTDNSLYGALSMGNVPEYSLS